VTTFVPFISESAVSHMCQNRS